jgi:CheY-like chemotaxis protein
VILDVLLEGENTWELLSELKRADATRSIPIYVVTLVENEAKARALGADAFCVKPVDRSWLLDKLNRRWPIATSDKILLIDDDDASRYLLKGQLAGMRLAILEAKNADEGMRRARLELPSAIFLDLDLPDQSGTDVLRALRSEAATENIPVIIHTSQPLGEEARRRLLAAGATAVLSKDGSSREERQTVLRQALGQTSLGSAT